MSDESVFEIELLANEMVEFGGSPHFRIFFLNAISALGVGLAREALGEVRMRCNEGAVADKSRYLFAVLRDWMGVKEPDRPTEGPPVQGLKALAVPEDGKSNDRFLSIPFSKKFIPHVTDLNGDFFALTNEVRDFDKVRTTVTVGSRTFEVDMIRGKQAKEDKGRGIPTVEHWRIVDVLDKIWADAMGPHKEFENSQARLCVCNTTAREICKGLGITYGGKERRYITQKILDLKNTGYLFLMKENPECAAAGIEDFSFQILGEVQTLTRIVEGKREKYFRIFFSEPYSRSLLQRKVVRRPLDSTTIRGDIALKLYDYLYRILVRKKHHEIELKNLLKVLKLPLAGWHLYPSQRKREFEKAIREINGRQTHDKEVFDIEIVPALSGSDFVLIARLKKNS